MCLCSCCPFFRLLLLKLLRRDLRSSFRASCGRFWVPKMTLRPSKIKLSLKRQPSFCYFHRLSFRSLFWISLWISAGFLFFPILILGVWVKSGPGCHRPSPGPGPATNTGTSTGTRRSAGTGTDTCTSTCTGTDIITCTYLYR